MGYELLVNGTSIATKQITAADALSAPSKFEISREVIRDGANEIIDSSDRVAVAHFISRPRRSSSVWKNR